MCEVEGYPPLHTVENNYVRSFLSSLLSSLLSFTVSLSQTFRSYDSLKTCAVVLSRMKFIGS